MKAAQEHMEPASFPQKSYVAYLLQFKLCFFIAELKAYFYPFPSKCQGYILILTLSCLTVDKSIFLKS